MTKNPFVVPFIDKYYSLENMAFATLCYKSYTALYKRVRFVSAETQRYF